MFEKQCKIEVSAPRSERVPSRAAVFGGGLAGREAGVEHGDGAPGACGEGEKEGRERVEGISKGRGPPESGPEVGEEEAETVVGFLLRLDGFETTIIITIEKKRKSKRIIKPFKISLETAVTVAKN